MVFCCIIRLPDPLAARRGLTAFCRIRSYLSALRKQGHGMLTALAAVFAGQPLPIAWTPG